jgi:hypothetical protein
VRGLTRAGSPVPIEIWCDLPLETARRRYEARLPRHPIHGALMTDDEWDRWRRTARPLRLGPTLHVDTTQPVDPQPIVAWIHARGQPGHCARRG